jgi:hypothetical protein
MSSLSAWYDACLTVACAPCTSTVDVRSARADTSHEHCCARLCWITLPFHHLLFALSTAALITWSTFQVGTLCAVIEFLVICFPHRAPRVGSHALTRTAPPAQGRLSAALSQLFLRSCLIPCPLYGLFAGILDFRQTNHSGPAKHQCAHNHNTCTHERDKALSPLPSQLGSIRRDELGCLDT